LEEMKKNLRFLERESVSFALNGAWIRIVGADDGDVAGLREKMESLKEEQDVFTILMYHRPDLAKEEFAGVADLYMCGHTHGGQVRLPWYGAVVTMSQYGKEFEMGRYDLNGTILYVNRGYGLEGGSWLVPKVRFLCRPEIALFTVVGTGGNA